MMCDRYILYYSSMQIDLKFISSEQFMMKAAVILALTLASVLSINMMSIQANFADANTEAILALPQKVNNLQISNYTGSGITYEMVPAFIKIINDAYTFYRDNYTANCEYIQNKLEGAYTYKFQVLIFPENSTADLRIYAGSGGQAFVKWSKVNTAQPLWSYIIVGLPTVTLKRASISGYYQKGTGISSNLQQVLQDTIKRYETSIICICYTNYVQSDLQIFDGQRWNVVCSSPKGSGNVGFGGIIYQKDEIYEQTIELTVGRCRYLAWVI